MAKSNIYELDGRVPVAQAVPFGLQHVLAMFVSNITPIIILAGVVGVDSVLGGCTIMMFGSILFTGFGMMAKCGFGNRNMIIASLSLSVGLGFTSASQMFNIFPDIIKTVFAENCVAVVFVLAVILNLILPKEKENA